VKTAVDKVRRGKRRDVNKRFKAMVSHFLFEAGFCNLAAGWEKGQVEKNVRDSRYRIWHNAPSFKTLDALNDWLELRCKDLWQEISHPEDPSRKVADVWGDECQVLMAVPAPFDGYVEHTKRISSTCLILCDRNRYSVPAAFANKPVSVRAYARRIVVVAEAHVIAEHTRVFSRGHKNGGKKVYDWRHYLRLSSASLARCAMALPSLNFPTASNVYSRFS
jgi:hypothetical protein